MKKTLSCAVALTLALGLTACSATEAHSDKAACEELASSLVDLQKEIKDKKPASIEEALALLKPLGELAGKAEKKASSEELKSALKKMSENFQNPSPANLTENIAPTMNTIESKCKAAGVDLNKVK